MYWAPFGTCVRFRMPLNCPRGWTAPEATCGVIPSRRTQLDQPERPLLGNGIRNKTGRPGVSLCLGLRHGEMGTGAAWLPRGMWNCVLRLGSTSVPLLSSRPSLGSGWSLRHSRLHITPSPSGLSGLWSSKPGSKLYKIQNKTKQKSQTIQRYFT